MFMVMTLQDFEVEPSPDSLIRIPSQIKIERGKMVGYCPVYATREDALADFPNKEVVEVRETSGEGVA